MYVRANKYKATDLKFQDVVNFNDLTLNENVFVIAHISSNFVLSLYTTVYI